MFPGMAVTSIASGTTSAAREDGAGDRQHADIMGRGIDGLWACGISSGPCPCDFSEADRRLHEQLEHLHSFLAWALLLPLIVRLAGVL